MRFLIVTRPNTMPPPEMASALLTAMEGWIKTHTASGKMEQSFGFAGAGGGGGILNVSSHEELDAIMWGFPFGPFSHVEIYPLVSIETTLSNGRKMIEQMAAGSAR